MRSIVLLIQLLMFIWYVADCSTLNRPAISNNSREMSTSSTGDLLIYTDGGPIPEYLLRRPYEIFRLRSSRSSRQNRNHQKIVVVPFEAMEKKQGRVVGIKNRLPALFVDKKTSANIERPSTTSLIRIQPHVRSGSQLAPRVISYAPNSSHHTYLPTERIRDDTRRRIERPIREQSHQRAPIEQRQIIPSSTAKEPSIAISRPPSLPSAMALANYLNTWGVNSKRNQDHEIKSSSTIDERFDVLPRPLLVSTMPVPVSKQDVSSSSPPLPQALGTDVSNDTSPSDETSFAFGYIIHDGLGTVQHREESSGEKGAVSGTYGYQDHHGLYRLVNYIADQSGYHAVVKTNEPGMENKNPADVIIIAEPALSGTFSNKSSITEI